MIGSSENRISYNGNGIATEFAYNFIIIEKSDIKVLHVAADGTEQLLTKDYYVDMEKSVVLYPGYAPGAEIPEQNRPPVLPVGERLVIYREVPITQDSALDKHWPFNVVESGLDKLTIICQQIWDRLQRSFYVSESTSSNFDPKVPIEAGKTFRVKDDGTGFEVTEDPGKVIDGATALLKQTTEQAVSANEAATNAQNAADRAEFLVSGNFPYVTPEMFGAVGDGITDDTQAIKNAINSNTTIWFQKDKYLVSPLLIENIVNISLIGNNTTLIFPDNTNNKKWLSFVKSSNVIVFGFIFDGNRENQTIIKDTLSKDYTENSPAILFDETNNARVFGCRFNNLQADGIQIDKLYYDQIATSTNQSKNIYIYNNIFSKCGRQGVSCVHCENVYVYNNAFEDITLFSTSIACGVDVEPNSAYDFVCKNINIYNNSFMNCTFGVNLTLPSDSEVQGITIYGNIIHGGAYALFINNAKDKRGISINNNLIQKSYFGIFGDDVYGCDIEYNTIKDLTYSENFTAHGQIGIYCINIINTNIRYNSIEAVGVYTIRATNSINNAKICYNTFSGDYYDNVNDAYGIISLTIEGCNICDNEWYSNKRFITAQTRGINNTVFRNFLRDNNEIYFEKGSGNIINDNKIKYINETVSYTAQTADTLEYTGCSVTIPAGSDYSLNFYGEWVNAEATKCAVSISNTGNDKWQNMETNMHGSNCSISGYTPSLLVLHFWCAWSTASANKVRVKGIIRT